MLTEERVLQRIKRGKKKGMEKYIWCGFIDMVFIDKEEEILLQAFSPHLSTPLVAKVGHTFKARQNHYCFPYFSPPPPSQFHMWHCHNAAKLNVVGYSSIGLRDLEEHWSLLHKKTFSVPKDLQSNHSPDWNSCISNSEKNINMQHSVNFHPIDTYLHVAMICPGKYLLIHTPTQVQGGRSFYPEGPDVQCWAFTYSRPLPHTALSLLT